MSNINRSSSDELYIVTMPGGHSVSFRSEQLADAMVRFLAKRGIDAELMNRHSLHPDAYMATTGAADGHVQMNSI